DILCSLSGKCKDHSPVLVRSHAGQQAPGVARPKCGNRLVQALADQNATMIKSLTPYLQGKCGIGQVQIRMLAEMLRQVGAGRLKRGSRLCRERQQLPGARRTRLLRQGGFLDYDVRIGAPYPKRADASPTWMSVRLPGSEFPVYVEGAVSEIDLRIGSFKVEA